ncbi:MAG: COG3014 family protein [Nitrospirales bacterium]
MSVLSGCSSLNHYRDVEKSLLAGNPDQADQLVRKAKKDYGQRNRLLYLMDRGMTLHLAGRYQESNLLLEDADTLIEDFYTTRIRDEVSAILLSETRLPYQGDPYEQVMVNVLKALNYAVLHDLPAALVEARRIDHRLNLIGDSVESDEYHEDPFARYLTGLLYESSGDSNNAFIAYRKAEEGYRLAESWSHVAMPPLLRDDLLRTSKAIGLTEEFHAYQLAYPEALEPLRNQDDMAQVVVVSLNGRGPTKKDLFLDVPISLDALQLIALTKNGLGRTSRRTRIADSVLYGLQGDIARVALPRVLSQTSPVSHSIIRVDNGVESFQKNTQRMYDVNAVAKKNLDDGYTALAIRAVARAAMKMAAAVSIGYGARSAVNKKSQAVVGLAAASIAKIFAIATEEADIRTWRTLPGEFQVARLWVPPGTYSLTVDSYDPRGQALPGQLTQQVTLKSGDTHFLTQRILR